MLCRVGHHADLNQAVIKTRPADFQQFVGVAFACIPLFFKRGSHDHGYLPDRVNRGWKPLPLIINLNAKVLPLILDTSCENS